MKTDLSSYTIRLANAAQEEEHWRASFVPWNRGKDWETFKQDQIKAKSEGTWAQNGAFRCWVLVKRDDLDGPIYSGCETFRRKSLMKRPGGKVEEVYSYAIASVVTPVQHLRQGFATHFLRLLHYVLASPDALPPFPTTEWDAPPPPLSTAERTQFPFGISSILFSDVGSIFYERATIGTDRPGWVIDDKDVQQITWKLSKPQAPPAREERDTWGWVYNRNLPAIAEELSAAARQHMEIELKAATSPVWAFDPASPGTLSFVPTTAMWSRAADPQLALNTEPCGIRLPSTQPGQEDAIVLFVASQALIGHALLVTYIHNLDTARLPILIEALDEAEMQMGMEEGWVWGLSAESELGKAWLAQEGRGVTSGRRNESMGHLLGVAWYGPPEDRGRLVDSQMWTWC